MAQSSESALRPFRNRTFAVMWLAALVSNIVTWMHSVEAGWLVPSLSPAPLIIAFVQKSNDLASFFVYPSCQNTRGYFQPQDYPFSRQSCYGCYCNSVLIPVPAPSVLVGPSL